MSLHTFYGLAIISFLLLIVVEARDYRSSKSSAERRRFAKASIAGSVVTPVLPLPIFLHTRLHYLHSDSSRPRVAG